jgi:regulator of protease activity HflC (stomatin/prohibitin superfamily)
MSSVIDADGDLIDREPLDADDGPWHHRVARAAQQTINKAIIFLGVLLLVAIYFAPQIFISVHSGEVGVLYLRFAGGTQTDKVLGEGMKIIPPWDQLFIYNVRVQEQKHVMDVLTNEGLAVKLALSIRYHPELELVGLLHQQVGPDYAQQIVIPEVESAVRATMGGVGMREVYGSPPGLVQKIINDSLEHVSQKFVQVDEVVLRSVTLPPKVTATIEEKMSQKELADSYDFRLMVAAKEADRLRIEASGLKAYQDILNSSLTPNILKWQGIEATRELARSPNTKTIVIGDKSGLPLIFGEK